VSLSSFLAVGAVLFSLGLYTALAKTNLISILMGIELMLNGAALNFASYSYYGNHLSGNVVVLFIMILAVLEAVVALTLIYSVFRAFRTVSSDDITSLREERE